MFQIIGIESPSTVFTESTTLLGDVASRILYFGLTIAAFYFFVRLLLGGYNLLTSSGDPAKIQAGQSVITSGLIGLIIVVSAFFVGQLLKAVLGINIPGL